MPEANSLILGPLERPEVEGAVTRLDVELTRILGQVGFKGAIVRKTECTYHLFREVLNLLLRNRLGVLLSLENLLQLLLMCKLTPL